MGQQAFVYQRRRQILLKLAYIQAYRWQRLDIGNVQLTVQIDLKYTAKRRAIVHQNAYPIARGERYFLRRNPNQFPRRCGLRR